MARDVIVLDQARKCIWLNGTQILLPRRQFAMCVYLASEPGVIRTRAEIMDALGISLDSSEKAVDSMIKHARARGMRDHILTRHCFGYYWREELIG